MRRTEHPCPQPAHSATEAAEPCAVLPTGLSHGASRRLRRAWAHGRDSAPRLPLAPRLLLLPRAPAGESDPALCWAPGVPAAEEGLDFLSQRSAWQGLCEGRRRRVDHAVFEGPHTKRGLRASPGAGSSKGLSQQGGLRCPEGESGGAGVRFAGLCLWHGKPGWKKRPKGSGVAGRSHTRNGYVAGKGTGAPASLPAAAPPCHPIAGARTSRRNRTSISRESVWKIPGFIRQADVQTDSIIPMHTMTGIYMGLSPSSLPPAMLSGESPTPPPPRPGAVGSWGFLEK